MIEKLEKIIESCGATLYDTESVVENDRKIFRIYITYKDGVKLEKCEEISKIVSPILDLNPPVNGHYFLEVSSPGIERNLKKPKHFISSVGELVKLKLNNGDKLQGKIIEANENEITVDDNGIHKVSYEDIAKANTYFEW
jgi:ribosome maturation factor RimP